MNHRLTSASDAPFVFFDLGNVLLCFDHQIACDQMAQLCELAPETIRDVVFNSPLQQRYERGEISSEEFYQGFCNRLQVQPDYQQLMQAASDIFQPADGVIQIVQELTLLGYQLGLLSNTCEAHWDWIQTLGFQWLKNCFETYVLSFQVHYLKPELEMYETASEQAQRPPAELLLIDDRCENVEGAKLAGWDAIEFVGLNELTGQLKKRYLLPC